MKKVYIVLIIVAVLAVIVVPFLIGFIRGVSSSIEDVDVVPLEEALDDVDLIGSATETRPLVGTNMIQFSSSESADVVVAFYQIEECSSRVRLDFACPSLNAGDFEYVSAAAMQGSSQQLRATVAAISPGTYPCNINVLCLDSPEIVLASETAFIEVR